MNATPDAVARLRTLSVSELTQVGAESLRDHLSAQAVVAHCKYAPLAFDKLESLLNDRECVRYPTRLVFEFGEMAMHQFAQPDFDLRDPAGDGRVLYLRPLLREHPELALLAAAYMIPVVNYGDVVTDDHCLRYGATLLGMLEEEFYEAICRLADFVGAEVRLPNAESSACMCSQ